MLFIRAIAMTPDRLSDEDCIRQARSLSNAAIARQDLDAIAVWWSAGIHVTGSTAAQLAGVEATRRFYAAQFARRPDTRWDRTPALVRVLAPWGVGLESGHWVGTWTDPDGPVRVGGDYMAQWLRSGGQWRIQAELYVPTECTGGAYCARHPSEQ